MNQPSIILIAAMSCNRVIGYQNKLPWHLPADLKYFREITQGKTVIMGRKTFESIGKRPLQNRRNIVITHKPNEFLAYGCETATSLEEAIQKAQTKKSALKLPFRKQFNQEIMIIGGQSIYEQALKLKIATHLYITMIDATFEGDAFFPQWDKDEWEEIERIPHKADAENPYDFCFLKFRKILKS